jgi:hypothetical protein
MKGGKQMKFVTSFAFAVAWAPCLAAQAVSGNTPPEGLLVTTKLESIREHPDAFKNVWVRFPIQFCSIGRVNNPFFTQFVPSQYANFYGWSAEQPIWRKESYDDLFGMLFLSKDSRQLQELYQIELYDRLWITGLVRNVFQDKPWIEVTEFEPLTGKVNTATLAHLYRAELHMQRREWTRAVSELSLAPAAGVPAHVIGAVHKNMGICYLRMGEAGTAREHLTSAANLLGETDREVQKLASNARERPEAELDRRVDTTNLEDSARPLWEAFERATPR